MGEKGEGKSSPLQIGGDNMGYIGCVVVGALMGIFTLSLCVASHNADRLAENLKKDKEEADE